MNICRTCLKTPADKDILQLENAINEDTKNKVDIMLFCLDIIVSKDSKITTNLCNNCYRKIINYYKFKTLSLKNDAYWKSLQPRVMLKDAKILDENRIKQETSLKPDECGSGIVENCSTEIKLEYNIEFETTEAIKSDIDSQSVDEDKKCEEIESAIKENGKITVQTTNRLKTLGRKRKQLEAAEVEQQRSVCDKCGKSVVNLQQHARVHKPQGERIMVRCKLCPNQFSTKSTLNRHHKMKHLQLQMECDICYKKVWNLPSHKRRIHDPASLPFSCVQCGRRCGSRSILNTHMLSHTKVLAYECDICQKKFGVKQHIINHILAVHEKVKPHQCHLCSKAYFTKQYLNDHLRAHANERPFKCDDCDKSFNSKDCLRKHRHIHSDTTFQCKLCDRSFVRQVNLKSHMVTHTKEKSYPCRICGVRFARSNNRIRHENTVHQKLTS